MARARTNRGFNISFLPEDIVGPISRAAVQAGIEVLKPKVQDNLEASISFSKRNEGFLARSLRASNTFGRDSSSTFHANIYFDGKSPGLMGRTFSNPGKAATLNTGTQSRQTRAGKYRGRILGNKFIPRAQTAARPRIEKAMQKEIENQLTIIDVMRQKGFEAHDVW